MGSSERSAPGTAGDGRWDNHRNERRTPGSAGGHRPRGTGPRVHTGTGFVLSRAPHKRAVDPATGEMYDDLVVITTPTEVEKHALVADESTPFFTIDHFKGYAAVLVQQSRLGDIGRDELEEIITDAWAAKAPKKLVREHLGE